MKKRKFDVGECSHITNEHRSSESMSDDLVLESKHKIFLSHSGVEKEFVEHLCKALEDRCHYPFFDRRPESLPKGKEFPSLIVKASQQCQLLIVVVLEEYFMSKWPMIELNAFVQARKVLKLNMNVAILLLFCGLSLSDLKDEKRRQRWFEKWKTFVLDDGEGRIKVEDWSYALDELTKFNGLSYDQELKEIVSYENAIVSHICRLVPPNIKWDDSHVQGNVHEVVFEKRKEIGLSPRYKVKVVGIYGVGGIGKTTMCKRLCNELSSEYEGRVCHVEFDIACSNSKELLQKASIELVGKQVEVVQQLGEGEHTYILRKSLFKQRAFLALDNVWDDDHSIKQALLFLNPGFHEESFIVVTAQSQSTLERLGIDKTACFEMPELSQAEATKLFLHYAANGKQFGARDMIFIEQCVAKCHFRKGNGSGFHYHSLALEVLGRQLGCLEEMPFEWVEHLGEGLGGNVVFDVLKIGFNLLHPCEQALFMDVGFFLPCMKKHIGLSSCWIGWKEQLCTVYKRDELVIQSQLDSLKQKGLLQDADLTLGRIDMHDLYYEFAKLEAVGKFGATTDMWNRKWLFVNGDNGDLSELEVRLAGGCLEKLSQLSIRQTKSFDGLQEEPNYLANPITNLEGIEWQYFSNVLVLQLHGLRSIHGRLNLKGMTCLRSLQLFNFWCLESLEGLESLKHLTCIDWKVKYSYGFTLRKTHVVGQFPTSVRYLFMEGRCVLSGCNVLAYCSNLIKLRLEYVEVGVLLDLSNCSSLESVEIHYLESLQTLSGLIARGSSRLRTLEITATNGIHIPRLDQLDGLVQLTLVEHDFSCEVSCLLSLTKLQVLTISFVKNFEHCIPHQLQELHYKWWSGCKAPCLNAFKQLQVLDFSGSHSLTQVYGMGDLPELQSLNLSGCFILERLPDLSKSRKLEELDLDCCYRLKIHEEDFAMLTTLHLLHPVRFSNVFEGSSIRLDIARRKVLKYLSHPICCPNSWLAWKEGTWEELELGLPPVNIGNRGIWDSYKFEDSRESKIGKRLKTFKNRKIM